MIGMGAKGPRAAKGYFVIQAPAWEVNPTLTAEFLEKEYASDARLFNVEYGAEFTDRNLGWIEEANDLLSCVDSNARPKQKAPPRMPHFLGFDIGLTKENRTAIAITHVDSDENVVLDLVDTICAGEGKFKDRKRLEFEDVIAWVVDICRRFYVSVGVFDQAYKIVVEQALHNAGLTQIEGEKGTPQIISDRFKLFKTLMYDRRVILYDWPRPEDSTKHCPYIEEMLALQSELKSKFITLVEKPKSTGCYDDMSDAIVRAVSLAAESLGSKVALASTRRIVAGGTHVTPGRHPDVKAVLAARQRSRLGGSDPSRQPRFAVPVGSLATAKKKSVGDVGPRWRNEIRRALVRRKIR